MGRTGVTAIGAAGRAPAGITIGAIRAPGAGIAAGAPARCAKTTHVKPKSTTGKAVRTRRMVDSRNFSRKTPHLFDAFYTRKVTFACPFHAPAAF